jgi:hypothetical protein
MARYEYKHELDFDADATLDARGKKILKAALAVASHAHVGQSRGKSDPQWNYISHPIMVYEIMRKLGENDPVILAAALLRLRIIRAFGQMMWSWAMRFQTLSLRKGFQKHPAILPLGRLARMI